MAAAAWAMFPAIDRAMVSARSVSKGIVASAKATVIAYSSDTKVLLRHGVLHPLLVMVRSARGGMADAMAVSAVVRTCVYMAGMAASRVAAMTAHLMPHI